MPVKTRPAAGGRDMMPKGDGLKEGWKPSSMGKTKPAAGGRDVMPKGDGLKAAWAGPETRGKLAPMDAAKKKVR